VAAVQVNKEEGEVRWINDASNGTVGCEIDGEIPSAAERMNMVGFAPSGEATVFDTNVGLRQARRSHFLQAIQ